MGYALYTINRNGEEIDAGYGVETTCEEEGCDAGIDRGLAHLCGEHPGGDEYGCGGYFCEGHLYMSCDGPTGERCARCRDEGR